MTEGTPLLEQFFTYDGKCGSCKHFGFKGYCVPTGIFRAEEESCNRYELKRGE